jgi:alcohol dehydrogenase
MSEFETARHLLKEFKGESYCFGNWILSQVGPITRKSGKNAILISSGFFGIDRYLLAIRQSLRNAQVELKVHIRGAHPNAPREDVFRIQQELQKQNPQTIISFGGGSTIDAVKAAEVLRTLGGDLESYFGTGKVSETLQKTGKQLSPHIAIQTAAGSAAHLTKYSNITDLTTGQKKLIVDEAIVPAYPMFDYQVTHTASPDLTADGAMDGIAHCVEVLYGSLGKACYEQIERIMVTALQLVLKHLPQVLQNPVDETGREALCLATDLGGYAIMLGGTNGGHLTSFSLVDILAHGRACAIMNPYYTVFFAPVIERPLRIMGKIYHQAGCLSKDPSGLSGRDLGVVVAEGMFAFARRIGFPTRLGDVKGFTQDHIQRALAAAKNPQLKMKLENMPVPLTAEMVDEYLGRVLEGARDGNLQVIQNIPSVRG